MSPDRLVSRRDVLRTGAKLCLGAPLLGAALSACAARDPYPHADDLRFPRPSEPVRWKIYPENQPIDSGLKPESDGVLQIFSWDSYLSPSLIRRFEKEMNVKVQLSTFYDMNEGISKIRAGAVQPDVFFPTLDVLGRLVAAELIQPLNRDYLTNFDNIWANLQDPFYDLGSQYTVPYSVYSTGIGWRNDLVHEDIATMDNPWSVVTDTAYANEIYVLDDYREAIGLFLLEQGIDDLNTEDAGQVTQASERLVDTSRQVNLKYSLDDYTLLAEGQAWIHQAWSGDMVTSPEYIPQASTFATMVAKSGELSYWFPSDDRGEVSNDVMAVPRTAAHPVLGHVFIDYLMDPDHAVENFDWVGYQQPLDSLTLDQVLTTFPWLAHESMRDCLVTRDAIAHGYRSLELSPGADALWQQAWLEFQSYG